MKMVVPGVLKAVLTSALMGVLASLTACGQSTPPASPVQAVPPNAEAAVAAPIKVKVVLVTMFEIGTDDDEAAGEFQLWKQRRHLSQTFEFGAFHDLHFDPDTGLLVMVTGIGTANSASSVMMLGMDPRFDLTQAYWLVAGIAGFDPEDASIGSAAWATYAVDGDLSHEIDPREMPTEWPFGYFARYTSKPFDEKKPQPTGEMFAVDAKLTEWAYQLTKDMVLPDIASLAQTRDLYTEHPNARRPPFVLKGDNLAAMTFWHGAILNDWANRWVKYWTDGKGEFVSSAMEETGTLQSLTYLANAGKVDRQRALVLRTASNYTMQPPGVSAAANLLKENEGYAGLDAALESAYVVGSKVIDTLITRWDVYQDRLPTVADIK
jgi:purine nucleoside permease